MRMNYKILSLALGVVLLGILGVGVVLAADPTPTPAKPASPTSYQNVFLDKLATILGKTQQEVIDAFNQARAATIDQMVADGRITQQQADRMKQRQQNGLCPGGGPFGQMRGGRGVGRMNGRFGGWWQPATPTPSAK